MNLKASIKNSYDSLADRAAQNMAFSAAFSVVRGCRVLHELLVPQRFFEKTTVVRGPADGNRASFSSWGNESSLWYLSRCFERSGLSIEETREPTNVKPEPSIRFVWHNRALSAKFRRRGWLVLPGQVRSRVDLSCGMDAVRARFLRSAKAAVRSIHRAGLRYHVFPCDDVLQQFYDEMYLPYRNVRFTGNPIVKEFDLVRDFARGSVMLAVTESEVRSRPRLDETLGALIIRRTGASATPDMPGVNGDPKVALERGVIEALYYFSLEWCHEQGVQSVDLGQSHPFLDDGILRFKSKWGARVEASETGLHNLAIRFLDNGWLGKHLLANHPPIILSSRKPPTLDRWWQAGKPALHNRQAGKPALHSRQAGKPALHSRQAGKPALHSQLPTANIRGLAYLPPDEFSYHNLRKLKRSRMIDGLSELVVVSAPESTVCRGAAGRALDTHSVTSEEGGASTAPTSQLPGIRFLPCYDLRYLADALNAQAGRTA